MPEGETTFILPSCAQWDIMPRLERLVELAIARLEIASEWDSPTEKRVSVKVGAG